MADFNVDLPEWKNEGAAPSENLQANGFQAYDKPPAPVFNYLFNRFTRAIQEVRGKFDTTTIPEGADLNTYTTPGMYGQILFDTAQTFINSPLSDKQTGIFLEVIKLNSGSILQILYGALFGGIYKRRLNSGEWSEWTRMATYAEATDLKNLGVTATATELNYLTGVTSNIQEQLDKKLDGDGSGTVAEAVTLTSTTIPEGADLNSYTTAGRYVQILYATAQTLLNNPLSSMETGIVLEVVKGNGGGVFQVLYGVLKGGIYKRRYNSGAWSSWDCMPIVEASTTDLTAGTSTLQSGKIYLVYE
ncbi:MAG: hypothetical protein IKK84_00155 [Clostridia bacterium]|nr:hypothetical protein [Clostridia bacterium]